MVYGDLISYTQSHIHSVYLRGTIDVWKQGCIYRTGSGIEVPHLEPSANPISRFRV